MQKILYGFLIAGTLAALAISPSCKGSKQGSGYGAAGSGCGEMASCGDGCGTMKGCGDGCGEMKSGGGGCGEMKGCGGGCGGGACGAAMKVTDADARHAMRLYRQYLTWNRANQKRFQSKSHSGHEIVYFVNNLGRDTLRRGTGDYPNGAAFGKEGWKNSQRQVVWFMEKRTGYDPDNGDWWYAAVNGKGKVMMGGKVAMCIKCHDMAGNDYIFGLPKK